MRWRNRWTEFLSTPSARRATRPEWRQGQGLQISIHALREEGDCKLRKRKDWATHFYPRPPRGGRREHQLLGEEPVEISIHALREEGDVRVSIPPGNDFYFYPRPPRGGRQENPCEAVQEAQISIHALREEGDLGEEETIELSREFLSTPSARRATAKTETKSLFSNKLYNILHEFRRALIYNGSKNYPNHAK